MSERLRLFPIAVYAVLLAVIAFMNGFTLPDELTHKVMGMLRDYLGKIQFSFWGIFANNLLAATVLFLGGFLLTLPSLLSYYLNFLALGAAFHLTMKEMSVKTFLVSIVPHGIFEIPAIVLAFILGTALAAAIVKKLVLKKDVAFRRVLKKLALIFLVVVVPLLVVAAFVEVNVTYGLMQILMEK